MAAPDIILPSEQHQIGGQDCLDQLLIEVPNLNGFINDISSGWVAYGLHGEIWKASYGTERVALKTMRMWTGWSDSAKKERSARLRNELMTWTRLKHPNILEFYGVCEHAPYWLGLVSPWMAFGDVKQYLQACPEARRSELLLDIAHGLAYMHSLDPPIVHGSVMLQNVLVKPTGEACIAGFAMSGVLRDSMEDLMNFDLYPGNPRLMAPEVMSPEEYGMTYLECYTPASDVYSFGMVAYELYSDRLPFDDIPSRYNVFLKVKAGGRPLHPGEKAAERGLRGGMWDIVQDCWRSRPEERPIARELVRRVAAVTGLDAESRPK